MRGVPGEASSHGDPKDETSSHTMHAIVWAHEHSKLHPRPSSLRSSPSNARINQQPTPASRALSARSLPPSLPVMPRCRRSSLPPTAAPYLLSSPHLSPVVPPASAPHSSPEPPAAPDSVLCYQGLQIAALCIFQYLCVPSVMQITKYSLSQFTIPSQSLGFPLDGNIYGMVSWRDIVFLFFVGSYISYYYYYLLFL